MGRALCSGLIAGLLLLAGAVAPARADYPDRAAPNPDMIRLHHPVVVAGTITSYDHNQVWIRLADGSMVEIPAMDLVWEPDPRVTQMQCVPGATVAVRLRKGLILRVMARSDQVVTLGSFDGVLHVPPKVLDDWTHRHHHHGHPS